MRSATKTFVGLAGIGVLVATAKLGLPTVSATANTVATVAGTTSTETPTPTPTPTPTATKTPAAKATVKTTKKTTTTKTTTTTVASVSKSGSAISYKYGVVQVKVTKKSGKITAISYLRKSATDGRAAVFPDLVVSAKAANGSNFGNIGGATFTTNAFKKALDSALAKF